MRRFSLLLIFLLLVTVGQSAQRPNIWEPFNFFLGAWKGTGKGSPGTSQLEREYKVVLGGKFINVNHKSAYQPQEKNPKGEVHEDWGYLSYDKSRKLYVLRQFHVEGFVTQYRTESIAADNKTIVFISEQLENLPAGYRAKETYRIMNDDEFVEVFELAPPGKDFSVYSENHFRRVK